VTGAPGPGDGGDGPGDLDRGHPALAAQLEAEEAATAYWRMIAGDRRVEAARVQRRPLVRAAIALDRWTRPLQDRAAATVRAGRSATDRLRARATSGAGPAPTGRKGAVEPDGSESEVDVLVLSSGPSTVPGARAVAPDEVDRTVADADAEVVVVLGPGVEPRGDWLRPLVAALADASVAAAVPCSVFAGPGDAPRSAHAGSVRSAGARVTLVGDTPTATVLPAPDEPTTVDLAAGRAVAVRRPDWQRAGGLGDGAEADLEAAVVDLGLRLTELDGPREVVVVPGSVVVDRREPRRRLEVRERPASDGAGWAGVVDRHGARLRRLARRGAHPVLGPADWSLVVTTATPSRKIAAHSGDWHYAGCFVDALDRAGIDARRQPIEEADSLSGRSRDVHLVLRGLEPVRRSPGQVHVLWVISHPEALTVAECDDADLVLVASERHADHLRTLTATPVEAFLQATEPRRFHPGAWFGARQGVTVVANTRGVRRASVDAAIAAGHPPTVHGLGWDGLVDPALIASTYVAFDDLASVYASSAIVLNDHWETMRLRGFASNRILDATAAGAVVVSDHLPEVVELFGDLVPTWRTAEELGAVLDELAADPDAARARADAARAIVLAGHTFDHRVRELDVLLRRHGLHPAPDTVPIVAPGP